MEITRKDGTKTVTADRHRHRHRGPQPARLPGLEFDGKVVITIREAMTLSKQPKKMAIIGAQAIGCEFADFYNAMGSEVIIIEMLPNLLPIEDEDCSLLARAYLRQQRHQTAPDSKTDKVEKTDSGVKLTHQRQATGHHRSRRRA